MTFRKREVDLIIKDLTFLRNNPYLWYGGKTDGFMNQVLRAFKLLRNEDKSFFVTENWCRKISSCIYFSYDSPFLDISNCERKRLDKIRRDFSSFITYGSHNHLCDFIYMTD